MGRRWPLLTGRSHGVESRERSLAARQHTLLRRCTSPHTRRERTNAEPRGSTSAGNQLVGDVGVGVDFGNARRTEISSAEWTEGSLIAGAFSPVNQIGALKRHHSPAHLVLLQAGNLK